MKGLINVLSILDVLVQEDTRTKYLVTLSCNLFMVKGSRYGNLLILEYIEHQELAVKNIC